MDALYVWFYVLGIVIVGTAVFKVIQDEILRRRGMRDIVKLSEDTYARADALRHEAEVLAEKARARLAEKNRRG